METRHGNLAVKAVEKNLEVENGRIRIRMFALDGGWAQEFHAADSKGHFHLILSSLHKNLLLASEHRACASPMISGDRPHLFAVCRESLRMVYSRAEVVHHDAEKIVVRLSGSTQGHSLECDMTLAEASNEVRVVVRDKIERGCGSPLVEYLMSSYAFLPDGAAILTPEDMSYAWAPSLRPGSDMVIGDRAFHSPAVILQKGQTSVALIPDLDILSEHRELPASLDLDFQNGLLPAPLLSYGFCGYEATDDGRYFRHDVTMSKRLDTCRLTYGYSLLLHADCKSRSAHKDAARFLWEKHGANLAEVGHGSPKPIVPDAEIPTPDAWAARGLHAAGTTQHNAGLISAARAMKKAVMSSPRDAGLFPTSFDVERGEWSGCSAAVGDAHYFTVECSQQLYWLLKWYGEVEKDARILAHCRSYARALSELRLRTGAIPSWLTKDRTPISALRSSMQTAASVIFLSELGTVTGHEKYVDAAQRSAKFVLEQLVPRYLYQDYTLMDPANAFTHECSDPHTGTLPQSGLAMLWAARMCIDLNRLTGSRSYLQTGVEILDQMCLLQSLWEKPFVGNTSALGLCARGNLGAAHDLELTAEFARCAIEYGAVTGEREYFDRGTAALNAALRVEEASALSRARIAASADAVTKSAGVVYVHVSKKWGAPTNGARLQRLDFGRGEVRVDVSACAQSNGDARVVFGGMRSQSYKLSVNGQVLTCSSSEMASGVQLPKIADGHGQHTLGLAGI